MATDRGAKGELRATRICGMRIGLELSLTHPTKYRTMREEKITQAGYYQYLKIDDPDGLTEDEKLEEITVKGKEGWELVCIDLAQPYFRKKSESTLNMEHRIRSMRI